MRPLPGALLDVFRGHPDRQSHHQDAHPEAVCDNRLRRNPDKRGLELARARPGGRQNAAGPLQGLFRRPKDQVAPERGPVRGPGRRERLGRDFRGLCHGHGAVFRRFHPELSGAKLSQENIEKKVRQSVQRLMHIFRFIRHFLV